MLISSCTPVHLIVHSLSFLLQSCSFVIQHCAYLNAMQNLYQTSFRLGTIRNWFQTGSNQFKPVWTSTNRSDSLLSSRTESKSFIFIPIPIPSIFINDFYKYFTFIRDSRTGLWSSSACPSSPGLHENAYFSAGFLNPKILFINFNQKKWLTAVRKKLCRGQPW